MHRVLIVGENTREVNALAFRLGSIGFQTAVSSNEAATALRTAFGRMPDAIVLDTEPGNGYRNLFAFLENVCQLPTIVLGSDSEEELVWYLEQGAADYIVKPVSPIHLSARLRALLRRTPGEQLSWLRHVGDLEVDLDRHEVRRRGRVVPLTPTEFRILRVLAERPGAVCTNRMILEQVWGEEFADCTHYLRLYIGYLRKKLEEDPRHPRLLVTEWGVGYRLIQDSWSRPAESGPARAASV